MPLVTYEEVLRWAPKIKEQALTRRMPIWHAARGYGAFLNDPTLSPVDLAAIVAWVDGGRVAGEPSPSVAARPQSTAAGAIPVDAVAALVTVRGGWATGWDFVPGDPLISSATFTSNDDLVIGTWTAGDRGVRLPRDSAVRVTSPVTVEISRRRPMADEPAMTPRPSVLRFQWLPPTATQPNPAPARRVWTDRVACGASLGPAQATIIGVRPLLAAGANAQITVERIGGARPELLGWFRDFDPTYARVYWLQQPIDFAANARISSDAPCDLDVVLSGRRSQTGPSPHDQHAAWQAIACTGPCAERVARTTSAARRGPRPVSDAALPSDPRTPRTGVPERRDIPPDR